MKTTIPDFDQPVNRQSTDAAKYDARKSVFGSDTVQPLWVADMDLPVPPFLQDALIKRIQHPCYGYTMQSRALKESIQWWMREEHGCRTSAETILFSPSVVTSMCNSISTCTGEGEGVALFSPVYERFYSSILNQKRKVINIPLCLDNGRYTIDLAAFEQACRAGKVKMVLFCNPQNPSGRVWSVEELSELVRICREYEVFLFGDEIHSDIIYPPNTHTSILDIDGAEKWTILAHSIGKTFNCSGLQPSFVLITDQRLRRRFRTQTNQTHTGDINLLAKIAIQALFSEEGQQYKKALIHYLMGNRDFLVERLTPLHQLSMMPPESTFLAWIDFRETGLAHDVIRKKLVEQAGLGLSDGLAYGPAGEGWFRLNFALARTELAKAVEKLEATFG
ncbi:MAG TPA: putative C-S lyase [Desulfobulbaceae bacterium]|nr:putative C-S lyase [Desulfobulbaceae bacterium]